MDSLGIFGDVSLKKSNDLMDVFEEALSKTNNLVETMDNFNHHKLQDKNNIINSEQEKNNNNDIKLRKLSKLKSFNHKRPNKFQLKPIKTSNKSFKIREPYNYQKEYENELINRIEQLFNPNYKISQKENVGMLSFLSPLLNTNLNNNKKAFYNSKERINDRKTNLSINKNSNNNKSFKSINYNKKKFDEKEKRRTKGKNLENGEKPEINRPINKAKTNAIKEIYFKSNKIENKSNVDLLINKLKKKYS